MFRILQNRLNGLRTQRNELLFIFKIYLFQRVTEAAFHPENIVLEIVMVSKSLFKTAIAMCHVATRSYGIELKSNESFQ